jgi:hypothetical protein
MSYFPNSVQSGRSRINKVVDGKKNRKYRRENVVSKTSFEKLRDLQYELFQEGFELEEYKKYVQEKINDDKFHYKRVTQEDIEKLYGNFERLIQKETNKYNEIGDEKKFNRKQRKMFREKRKRVMDEKKTELISELFKELVSSNTVSSKVIDLHKPDASQWDYIKKNLFPGNSYLLDKDRKWAGIYGLIESMNSAHIVGCYNHETMNQYVYAY